LSPNVTPGHGFVERAGRNKHSALRPTGCDGGGGARLWGRDRGNHARPCGRRGRNDAKT